jgi:hypothetical protein
MLSDTVAEDLAGIGRMSLGKLLAPADFIIVHVEINLLHLAVCTVCICIRNKRRAVIAKKSILHCSSDE